MAQRVEFWGRRVDHVLKKKTVSNCKILTNKLSQYQIEYVFPKIYEQLRFMFEYFKKMYKGMYCAMCDSKSHQYISFEREEIHIGSKTCRK